MVKLSTTVPSEKIAMHLLTQLINARVTTGGSMKRIKSACLWDESWGEPHQYHHKLGIGLGLELSTVVLGEHLEQAATILESLHPDTVPLITYTEVRTNAAFTAWMRAELKK